MWSRNQASDGTSLNFSDIMTKVQFLLECNIVFNKFKELNTLLGDGLQY